MQALNKFHQYILPDVPGAPISVVNSALLSTIIDFCEKSLIWKKRSEETDIVAGYNLYSYAPETGTKVVEADAAFINGSELTPTTEELMNMSMPGWQSSESATPKWFYMTSDKTIRIIPTPTEDISAGLVVDTILRPTRDATEVPDFIYEDWAETIAYGTLSRLMAMANRTWSAPQMVSYYTRKYRQGLSRAKSKELKRRQRITQTSIQPRRFGDVF